MDGKQRAGEGGRLTVSREKRMGEDCAHVLPPTEKVSQSRSKTGKIK